MYKFIELVIGGALGTLARYAMAGIVYRVAGANFPYGTLAVNLSGCLILGFLSNMSQEKFLFGTDVKVFLMIGFCGAFTTFSTFIFETNALIRDGQALKAFMNISLSLVVGFALFRLGILIGEAL
jgi:CrcB protein